VASPMTAASQEIVASQDMTAAGQEAGEAP
jgi:hypothetical protein